MTKNQLELMIAKKRETLLWDVRRSFDRNLRDIDERIVYLETKIDLLQIRLKDLIYEAT